jgi:hypothetical protein
MRDHRPPTLAARAGRTSQSGEVERGPHSPSCTLRTQSGPCCHSKGLQRTDGIRPGAAGTRSQCRAGSKCSRWGLESTQIREEICPATAWTWETPKREVWCNTFVTRSHALPGYSRPWLACVRLPEPDPSHMERSDVATCATSVLLLQIACCEACCHHAVNDFADLASI